MGMRLRRALVLGTIGCLLVLTAANCGSKGEKKSQGASGTLVLGASMSLTGSLAREGLLTKEGYELCKNVVNAKGGVPVGDTKHKLHIRYQDDTSKPDTAGQPTDQFNDQGIEATPGPNGSANHEPAA